MPHFIIDCSQDVLKHRTAEDLMNVVYEVANASGLFTINDIKVRLRPFEHFKLGENKENFIHIFGYIMEGRSVDQKAKLAKEIITKLNELVGDISFLSININEFELVTYSNKSMINPLNINNDRHFEL